MNRLPLVRIVALVSALVGMLCAARSASGACMNRFVIRTERPLQVVTILTGKLTFQEAKQLADDIQARESPPVEWLDDDGKPLAKQYGELKVVRPMPVGCDGKPSGVIMIVRFPSAIAPSRKMTVRLKPDLTVELDEQEK